MTSIYLDPPTEKQYDWNEEHAPGQYPGGFFLRTPDVYLQDPFFYLPEALEAGFDRFIISQQGAMGTGIEALSFMRANGLHAGRDIKFLLVDRHGATEYSIFSTYDKPLAVYPVWSGNDRFEDLIDLIEKPIGQDSRAYDNSYIPLNLRPIKNQPHKILIRQPVKTNPHTMTSEERRVEKDRFAVQMSNIQRMYPDVEIIFTGSTRFDVLLGHGFSSVGYRLHEGDNTGWTPRMVLPNGKLLAGEGIFEPAWADWFELVGWRQEDLYNSRQATRFALASLAWARRYFNSVIPFVHNGSSRKNILSPEFWEARGVDFKLPKNRRNLMHNSKLNLADYDRFACDTCILQTSCKLFRQGSICVVKGSEGVALADSFGTRNVDKLLGGLVKLVEKQAARLDDSIKAEEDAGEINPEVTKQFNNLFANGVKLAKLLDPSLNGGPSVSVNVGVGAGGIAAISTANPKQVVARVIEELESSGIAREDITPEMIQGFLKNMGDMGVEMAKSTVAVGGHVSKYDAPKALPATPSPDDGIPLDEFFGFSRTIPGETVGEAVEVNRGE